MIAVSHTTRETPLCNLHVQDQRERTESCEPRSSGSDGREWRYPSWRPGQETAGLRVLRMTSRRRPRKKDPADTYGMMWLAHARAGQAMHLLRTRGNAREQSDCTCGTEEGQGPEHVLHPQKNGFALDVGLPVGGWAILYSASRAGDGIRTRECLLGNRVTLSSPVPLAFPWIPAMTPSVTRRIK